MMNSVLQAIGQYIDAKQPPQLTWSPVAKSRAGANNPMVRESVYFLWAAKNIFPPRATHQSPKMSASRNVPPRKCYSRSDKKRKSNGGKPYIQIGRASRRERIW